MTHSMKTCSNEVCGSVSQSLSAERPIRGFMPTLVAAVDTGLELAVDTLFAWQRRRADRMRLQSMDDHILRDVGLSRADIEAEASKPFWRP